MKQQKETTSESANTGGTLTEIKSQLISVKPMIINMSLVTSLVTAY